MTIADEILRLNNAKAAIKTSLENKGAVIPDSDTLDKYAVHIDNLEVGGGSGDPYYEDLFNMITNDKTDYSYLFYNSNLTSLDLNNLDTSNVTKMNYMFQNCTNLTSLDLSNFDTSNVNDMNYMFSNCSKLITLDVSNFDMSKVTNTSGMFTGSRSLTSIEGLCDWDTSKVTNISNMFTHTGLTSLDVSSWDVGHITSYYYFESAFNNCTALVDFNAPKNINSDMNVSNSTALSHDSLMSIINNLKTLPGTKKLTLGATNLAKLTEEEIAIGTAKGWTIK